MFKSLLYMSLMALAASTLSGQTAEEVANNLTLPPLEPGAKKIPLPKAPQGVKIEFGGADYEQIIGKGGKIVNPVISDTPVLVYFKVTKDGKTVDSKDYEVVVKPKEPAKADTNPKPDTVPVILQWKGGQGEWKPGKELRVYCTARSLPIRAFCTELRRILPNTTVNLVKEPKEAHICLTCNPEANPGSPEAYTMKVTPQQVSISGNTPAGVYMGTRTLLQILTTQHAAPCGEARDFPRYKVRGCMLDIARTMFSIKDLHDLVDLMAWYKMNDLHLVINNNYIFHENYVDANRDPLKESYAAFRLESKVKGKDGTPLTAQDLSYSKREFRELIDYAKARGVNIVPEIDTPGHALSFTRVRPDLIYQGKMPHHPKRRCEMLDAARPETLRFVESVFDEYLMRNEELKRPVFDNCVVHVGSDEFFGTAEDYRTYTNGILTHVLKLGYTPRVWGSLSAKQGKTPVVSKGVQMNIWSKDWMLPQPAVEQGYDVINTFDRDLYIVPFANYYRMDRNHKGIYENWIPNRMGPQQLPAGHPQLLGATFAVWNDLCDLRHNGYGMADITEIIAGSLDVLCGKLWGEQKRAIPFAKHRELVKTLGYGPALEDPNPNASWDQSSVSKLPAALRQIGVRPPYHLTLEGVTLAEAPSPGQEQELLSGPEGVLLGVMKNGKIGFRRADGMEFFWDTQLPVGEAVKLEIIATPGKTRLLINGQEVEKLTLNNFNSIDEGFQKRTRDLVSTFILPGHTLGKSFRGKIKAVKLNKN